MANIKNLSSKHKIKKIIATSIPAALEKAQQYRALGQAFEAESICLDILICDPKVDEATILLLLSLTDQFEQGPADLQSRALSLLPKLKDDYERYYYEGIICERQCKALLHKSGLRSRHHAYDFLLRAMNCYAEAESLRPENNDETLLRWNTCVRLFTRYPYLEPAQDSTDLELE